MWCNSSSSFDTNIGFLELYNSYDADEYYITCTQRLYIFTDELLFMVLLLLQGQTTEEGDLTDHRDPN
jgi:hypothetical protein